MNINKFGVVLVIATLVLSACSAVNTANSMDDMQPTEAMMEKPMEEKMMEEAATEAPMMDDMDEGEMMDDKSEGEMMEETESPEMMSHETPSAEVMMDDTQGEDMMMESPAWFGVALTNVQSGEVFTINDYQGQVVLVETMAQWCSNCKKQQQEVKSLHDKLGMADDLVTIALDIDPNEDGETLKTYAQNNGFDWIYAVSPAEVSHEIGSLYGDQFLNPPSTPILIIDRKGEVHVLPFGIKSADDLLEAIQPYLNDNM